MKKPLKIKVQMRRIRVKQSKPEPKISLDELKAAMREDVRSHTQRLQDAIGISMA